MSHSTTLEHIQEWMQNFIVNPADDHEVLHAEENRAVSLILPSPTLSPAERVFVYRDMYLARMTEALESDYPGVQHFLGYHAFYDLVARYVEDFPSRSYNLSRLSDHLPDYIEKALSIPRRGFVLDMARFELALCQVFEADDVPTLSTNDIAAVPEEAWSQARLRPVKALALLELNYPVNDYLTAVNEQQPLPSTARKKNWVVIFRRNYDMWRMPLTRGGYSVLNALAQGTPLGATMAAVTRGRYRMDPNEVFRMFSRWVGEGMSASVELGPR